jgi:hypothetical protein
MDIQSINTTKQSFNLLFVRNALFMLTGPHTFFEQLAPLFGKTFQPNKRSSQNININQ